MTLPSIFPLVLSGSGRFGKFEPPQTLSDPTNHVELSVWGGSNVDGMVRTREFRVVRTCRTDTNLTLSTVGGGKDSGAAKGMHSLTTEQYTYMYIYLQHEATL